MYSIKKYFRSRYYNFKKLGLDPTEKGWTSQKRPNLMDQIRHEYRKYSLKKSESVADP
jgi:hypothetical protein